MVEAYTGISWEKYRKSLKLGSLLPHNHYGQQPLVDEHVDLSRWRHFWYALPDINVLSINRPGTAIKMLMQNTDGTPYQSMSGEEARTWALYYGFDNSITDTFFDRTGILVENSNHIASIAHRHSDPGCAQAVDNYIAQVKALRVLESFDIIQPCEETSIIERKAVKKLGSKNALAQLLKEIFARPRAFLAGWKKEALDKAGIIPGHEDEREIIVAATDLIPLADFVFEKV